MTSLYDSSLGVRGIACLRTVRRIKSPDTLNRIAFLRPSSMILLASKKYANFNLNTSQSSELPPSENDGTFPITG
jgi:hypothetical protein